MSLAGWSRRFPCVTTIARLESSLHLTFDDGPDVAGTGAVLDVLERRGARATFFVVAAKARRHPGLLRRIVAAGHTVGNHSLDHSWRPFFGRREALLAWVDDAEKLLQDLLGGPTAGFRSPAGVRTPQLHWALTQLGLPLIHWNVRFYDAAWRWGPEKALASLAATPPGSIVLLHDRQRPGYLAPFVATLAAYAYAAQERGFALLPIHRTDCPLLPRLPG